MRGRTAVAMGVSAAMLLAARPGMAGWAPGLVVDAGKTGAIDGPLTAGGLSLGFAGLWPVDESPWRIPIRFGVMAYFDDMGGVNKDLYDPTGAFIGVAEAKHQTVYGGAFRLDWEPSMRWSWRPYGSGTWGYYRVQDSVRGTSLEGVSSTGFSLAAGVQRHVGGHNSIGAVVRYHRLFNDVTGRYVSGAVEWGWRGVGGR
ncbi:MAG: hypothetical protein ACHQ52_01045 [Candidatus Eisenbacteria bacterium]